MVNERCTEGGGGKKGDVLSLSVCTRRYCASGNHPRRENPSGTMTGEGRERRGEKGGMVTMTNGRFHRLNKYQGTRDICAQSSSRGITPFNENKYKIARPFSIYRSNIFLFHSNIMQDAGATHYLLSRRCLDINFWKLRYLVRKREREKKISCLVSNYSMSLPFKFIRADIRIKSKNRDYWRY